MERKNIPKHGTGADLYKSLIQNPRYQKMK